MSSLYPPICSLLPSHTPLYPLTLTAVWSGILLFNPLCLARSVYIQWEAPPTKQPMTLQLGQRIEVKDGVHGIIRHIGPVEGKPGQWVGLELDTPVGLNDGSSGGRRYFQCPPKYGLFVQMDKLEPSRPKTPLQEARELLEEQEARTVVHELEYPLGADWSLFSDLPMEYYESKPSPSPVQFTNSTGLRYGGATSRTQKRSPGVDQEDVQADPIPEEEKRIFCELSKQARDGLKRLEGEVEKLRERIGRLASEMDVDVVDKSEHDHVVSLVARIYDGYRNKEHKRLRVLVSEFRQIMARHGIAMG